MSQKSHLLCNDVLIILQSLELLQNYGFPLELAGRPFYSVEAFTISSLNEAVIYL